MSFSEKREMLYRASPVKPGKRFVSFFIDFIITFIVSYLLFLLAFQGVKGSAPYQKAKEDVATEIAYYNEYFSDSKIVDFIDEKKETRKDEEIMVIENLSRAIYHSYVTFGNTREPDFIIPEEKLAKVSQYGEASLENDSVSYFYIHYVVEHPEMKIVDYRGSTPLDYLYEKYDSQFQGRGIYEKVKTEGVPILTSEAAYKMYVFLFENEDSDVSTEGKKIYSSFYNYYVNLLNEAETLLIRSEPYYSTHYKAYREAFYRQGRYTNITLFFSMMAGYLLAMLLPKLLLKNERTLGRWIMQLGVITREKETSKWYAVLAKTLLGMFGFMSTMILVFLFPPFNGIYDFLFMPLISGASAMTLGLLLVIITLLALINYVPTLFTHYKTSLLDMAFHDFVVDIKHIDEGDFDDEYEGKSY